MGNDVRASRTTGILRLGILGLLSRGLAVALTGDSIGEHLSRRSSSTLEGAGTQSTRSIVEIAANTNNESFKLFVSSPNQTRKMS